MIRQLSAAITLFIILFTYAWADTGQARMGYLVSDKTLQEIAKLSVEEFAPFESGANLGFIDKSVWVRIDLAADQAASLPTLVVTPVHLDRIRLYRLTEQPELLFEAGDTVVSPMSVLHYGYTYSLAPQDHEAPLLVRLESKNVMQPSIDVSELVEVVQRERTNSMLFSIAVAASVLYLLWALITLYLQPSGLLLAFIVRITLLVITLAVHTGSHRMFLFGADIASKDSIHNILALVYITAAQYFDYRLLIDLRRNWQATALLIFLVVASVLKAGLYMADQTSLALLINNVSALISLVMAVVILITMRKADDKEFRHFWRLSFAYFMLQLLPLFGLLATTVVKLEKYQSVLELVFLNYSIVPGALVTYLLILRHHAQVRKQAIIEEQNRDLTTRLNLEEAQRAEIRNLLHIVSHEVKTPLATLQMAESVGMLDSDLINASVRNISHVLQQCNRVEEIEAGSVQVSLHAVDLRKALEMAARDSDVEVRITGDSVVRGIADANLVQIVFQNLLHNAEKYRRVNTPNDAYIKQYHGRVTIAIRNRFDAAQPPDCERIFLKYYRHTTSTRTAGTGLGLYIARQCCTLMHASISARIDGDLFEVKVSFRQSV